MSEMEELKAKTDKQATIQKMQSISKYLDKLIKNSSYTFHWHVRADLLGGFSLIGYSLMALTGVLMNCPPDLLRIFLGLGFIVAMIAFGRSLKFTREFHEAEAEWKGAITILELLGMVPPAREHGIQNKKKVWNEMADVVKGWFRSKKEAQAKVYA